MRLPKSGQASAATRVSWPLVAAFVLGAGFSETSAFASAALYGPLTIILGLSVWLVSTRPHLRFTQTQSAAVLVGMLIFLSSAIGALLQSDSLSGAYTTLLLLVWIAAAIIGSALGASRVIASFALSGVIVSLGFLALTYDDLTLRLLLSGTTLAESARYGGPFEAHPNLIGHMMGLFALVIFWQARELRWKGKLLYWTAAATAFAMCVAASSRGGLIAAAAATGATYVLASLKDRKLRRRLALLTLVSVVAAAFYLDEAFEFLVDLLQLNSEHRGVGTGLTGRTDLWAYIVDQFWTARVPLLWGGGFRNEWINGITVDNSYLVILAEAGVLGLVLWVGRALLLIKRSVRSITIRPETPDLVVCAVLLFSVAEAVVNRQFLAIGNPASLLVLMLVVIYKPSYKRPSRRFVFSRMPERAVTV